MNRFIDDMMFNSGIPLESISFTCKLCGNEQYISHGDLDNFPICYRCRAVLRNMIWKEEHNIAKKKDGELNET